jgi:hypothetical protein
VVAAIGAEDARLRPIEHRLAEALRLPSLVVWIIATVLVLVLCTAWHNATGAWRGFEVGGEPFWRTAWRLEIMFAVILGYVFACGGGSCAACAATRRARARLRSSCLAGRTAGMALRRPRSSSRASEAWQPASSSTPS